MDGETDNLPVEGGTDNARALTLDGAANLDFQEPEEANLEHEVVANEEEATEEASEADDAGVEGGEAGSEQPKPEPADDVHITVNGEKVPLAEVKLGYMRQADYSRKTQEVASRRKGLEEMTARATGAVNTVVEFLAKQIPEAPDAALAATNPAEYVQRRAMHEQALAQVQNLLAQASEVKSVAGALTQEQRKELIDSENAKLSQAFPQTRTQEGRKAFFETAAATAKTLGYSDEEIGQATDHRLFALAHYAAKGMQAEKAQEKARAKAQNAPPVAPQKARPQGNAPAARRNQEALKRLARTGSIDDAMNIDWS